MTTTHRPELATHHLVGHTNAYRDPAELNAVRAMLISSLEQTARDAGGTGITDPTFVVEDEPPDQLAMRQDHENTVAEDEDRQPRKLTPLRWARSEARIVYP